MKSLDKEIELLRKRAQLALVNGHEAEASPAAPEDMASSTSREVVISKPPGMDRVEA